MPASPRRKAFGQHFLRDEKVIRQIVSTTFENVDRYHAKGLLEIGPGRGAITRPLLEAFDGNPQLERFLIVEKDRKLADLWMDECKKLSRVDVRSADFLDVDSETVLERKPLIVVSNLPYSSGTAILQQLATLEGIPAMVLMFQAEVAARLRATPGEKAWGSLSIWIQNRWDVRKLLSVPPGAFAPPPDVNSEVVVLEAREKSRITGPSDVLDKLVRVSFLHRRKMLRSGLPKGSPFHAALEPAGIDGTRRAEDLDWADWQRWMDAICR